MDIVRCKQYILSSMTSYNVLDQHWHTKMQAVGSISNEIIKRERPAWEYSDDSS